MGDRGPGGRLRAVGGALAALALAAGLAGCPLPGDDGDACDADAACASGLVCDRGLCRRLGLPQGPLALHVLPPESSGFSSQAFPLAAPSRDRIRLSLCPPSELVATVRTPGGEPAVLAAVGESGIPGVRVRLDAETAEGELRLRLPPGGYRLRAQARQALGAAAPAVSGEVYLGPCEDASIELETPDLAETRTISFRLVSDPASNPAPRCGVRVQALDAETGEPLSAPLVAAVDPATRRCEDELHALAVRGAIPGQALRLRLVVSSADSGAPTVPTQELLYRFDPVLRERGLCADHDPPWGPGECLCDRVCVAEDGARADCNDREPLPREALLELGCRIGVSGPVAGATTPAWITLLDEAGAPVPPSDVATVVADGVVAAAADEACELRPDPPQVEDDRCGWGFQEVGGARFRSAPGVPRADDPSTWRVDVLPGAYRVRATPTLAAPYATAACVVRSSERCVPEDPATCPGGASCDAATRTCVGPGGARLCDDRVRILPPRSGTSPAPSERNELVVVLGPKLPLEGSITLAGSRTPAFDARVTALRRGLEEPVASDFTSARGLYQLLVEPGEYRLLVQPGDESAPWTYAGPVAAGGRLDVRLEAAARVVGTVTGTDAGGARPLARAVVRAYRCEAGCFAASREELAAGSAALVGEAVTDADGSFSMVLPAAQ